MRGPPDPKCERATPPGSPLIASQKFNSEEVYRTGSRSSSGFASSAICHWLLHCRGARALGLGAAAINAHVNPPAVPNRIPNTCWPRFVAPAVG